MKLLKAIIICLFLVSCTANNVKTTKFDELKIESSLVSVNYNKNNEIISKTTEYFASNQQIVKKIINESVIEYKYIDGLCISVESDEFITMFDYDEGGLLVHSTSTSSDGKIFETIDKEYDKDGNQVYSKTIQSEDIVTEVYIEYNNNNQPLIVTSINNKGEKNISKYTYNEMGDISNIEYILNDLIISTIEYIYESGKLVQTISTSEAVILTTYFYYDELNRIIEEKTSKDFGSTFENRIEYSYKKEQ